MSTLPLFPAALRRSWLFRRARGQRLAGLFVLLALSALWPVPASAQTTVADCTEEDLLIALATGGDVLFTKDCDITLTAPIVISADTTIDGGGFDVRLDGSNSVQLLQVRAGVTLTLSGLTLSAGHSDNGGALFINPGATVIITNCNLSHNSAQGLTGSNGLAGADSPSGNGGNGRPGVAGTPAAGGAIYNLGNLLVTDSQLQTNSVVGGNGGNGGDGGNGNANGGNGGGGAPGGAALGGAIYNAGTLRLVRTTLGGNTASGGAAGTGGAGGKTGLMAGLDGSGAMAGAGSGAAVYSLNSVVAEACTFSGNSATGGTSTGGGTQENRNGFSGFHGAAGQGGGLCLLGISAVTNCTFYGNAVTGGGGGNGGGGGANAGDGGNGGAANGGGLYNAGSVAVVNCTFAFCAATGGSNGVAGPGRFNGEDGQPGAGRGAGLANAGSLKLMNSLFATNAPGTNLYNLSGGALNDAGYNLSSDKSPALTSGTSLKNVDPRIKALADNTGPTLTVALSTNSPAVDRIPTNVPSLFPPTDQRGVDRPIGKGADIGAFELVTVPDILTQPQSQTQTNGGQVTFTVEAIGDSLKYQWRFNGVAIPGATGSSFTINHLSPTNQGSYTVVIRNGFGSVTSEVAFLTVTIAPNTPPTITQQPTNQTVALGGQATFSVSAFSAAPLLYQWRMGGTNLAEGGNLTGTTSSQLTIANVQSNNVGDYLVVITNGFGAVTSSVARLAIGDRVAPAVAVTNLAEGQVLATNFVTLAGTAADVGSAASSNVTVKVNGVRTTNDTFTAQGILWSFNARLVGGTNTFNIVATDPSSNATTLVLHLLLDTNRPTVAITAPTKSLQSSNVSYKVAGTAQDNVRVTNVSYQLNAGPWLTANGTSNWTAQITLVPGTNTLRAFAQDSVGNRSLTNATVFVYNQFLGLKGSYSGLFFPTNSDLAASNAGLVSLTLSDQGKFTGRLLMEGKTYTVSGSFDTQLQSVSSVKRTGKTTLTLALALTPEINRLTGSILSSNEWQAELLAYRADPSRANARAGSYTLLITPPAEGAGGSVEVTNAPSGDSPASVKVSTAGAVTLSGSLANGTAISQSAAVSEQGDWALYVSLNGGRGLLLGWLDFSTNQPAELYWLQPARVAGSYYTNGFARTCAAWVRPWSKSVGWTNAEVVLSGGNLPEGVALTNRVSYSNSVFRVVAGGSITNLKLSATASTGLFQGSFLNPWSKRTTLLNGVLEPKSGAGAGAEPVSGGWWLGPKGEGGKVWIFPE